MDFDWAVFVEESQNNRSLLGDWAELNPVLINKLMCRFVATA